jgi:hypothetical protein
LTALRKNAAMSAVWIAYTVGGFLTFILFCGLYADRTVGTFPYFSAAVACLFWPVVVVALIVAALRD